MQMVFALRKLRALFVSLDERLSRFRLLIGAVMALSLAAGMALLSVSHGPLYNLNDIGGFGNRAVFIVLACAAYGLVLLMTAALHRGNLYRMLLRQLIVTAGFLILMTGINQKTYFYMQNIQPMIRAMDASGLSALAQWDTSLSAPAATLLYLITRGPVYDMYMVKLLCVTAFMALCVLAAYAADKSGLGLRTEVLLALCLILPSGFMSAACTALIDGVCAALLAFSLALACHQKDCPVMKWTAAALWGLSLSLSGLALYALPVFALLAYKRSMTACQLALSFALPLAACLPAIACGMPAFTALGSLIGANIALPPYAAGSPGMFSMIPRALVEEMPAMFQLRTLSEIDMVTNAQPLYTQAHFEHAALGFAVAGIAVYSGVFAYVLGRNDMTKTQKAFTLTLGALIVCPGATNAAWIGACVLSLYALFADKKLRLPACMVLFAVSGAAAYPMLEETLLPMVMAFVLCLCALLMVIDIIPTTIKEREN